MANNDVEIGINVQDKDQGRAWARMQAQIDQIQGGIEKLGKKGKQAGKETEDGFKMAVGVATKYLGTLAAVQTAQQLIRQELQAIIALQQKAAGATVNAATAERDFLLNLGNVGAKEQARVQKAMQGIADRTKQPLANVYTAGSSAVSAQGGYGSQAMLDATETAMRLAPHSVEASRATAGGLLDLASVTGTANAEENAGTMLGMGAQTRVQALDLINKNLVPGAIGTKGYGFGARESMSLVTTLSSGMKDTTGATAKTAAIALAQQLTESKMLKGTPEERLASLQSNPKLRDKFMAGANFEKEARIPVRDLLTGGSDAAKLFAENTRDIPLGTAAAAGSREFIKNVDASSMQQTAALDRAYKAATDKALLGDPKRAQAGVNISNMAEFLPAQGMGWTETQAYRAFVTARTISGADPNEAAADAYGNYRSVLRRKADPMNPGTAEQKQVYEKSIQALDEQIALLRELVEQGKDKDVVIAGDKRGNVQPKASGARGLNDPK